MILTQPPCGLPAGGLEVLLLDRQRGEVHERPTGRAEPAHHLAGKDNERRPRPDVGCFVDVRVSRRPTTS